MGTKFEGFDELQRELEDMGRRVQELDGEHTVSFDKLFPSEFVQKHSSMDSMQDLMDKSGFKIEGQEDFEGVPDAEWNAYIQKVTMFPDWQTMMDEAVKEYIIRKLGL